MLFRNHSRTLLAVMVALSACASAFAAPAFFSYVTPFTGPLKHIQTYFESYNEQGLAIGDGNWYGSPLSINCPNAAGCYVVVVAHAQINGFRGTRPASMGVQIGSFFDGAQIRYLDNDTFNTLSYQTGTLVPKGTHRVMTSVYSGTTGSGASLWNYSTEVRIYKPI